MNSLSLTTAGPEPAWPNCCRAKTSPCACSAVQSQHELMAGSEAGTGSKRL